MLLALLVMIPVIVHQTYRRLFALRSTTGRAIKHSRSRGVSRVLSRGLTTPATTASSRSTRFMPGVSVATWRPSSTRPRMSEWPTRSGRKSAGRHGPVQEVEA